MTNKSPKQAVRVQQRRKRATRRGYIPRPICANLPSQPVPEIGTVLITGASGYIGGRLIPELINRGYKVRLMVRGAHELAEEKWHECEVVEADAHSRESLYKALENVHAVYYLIHSLLMGPRDFEEADIVAARNFREVAEELGIKRIIYLGGIGDTHYSRSRHLRNRMAVAEELCNGQVPVTTLRAAVIIGSGSASYEILRGLVEKLHFLPVPKWAGNKCQPIGVGDVIRYLVGVLENPATRAQAFDIGGKDVITYKQMLYYFARLTNKSIIFCPSPLLSIKLHAYVTSLITPVPQQIIECLLEGLQDETVCRDEEIRKFVPFEPLSYRGAVVRALTREQQDGVRTRWSDSYPPAHELALKLHELQSGPDFISSYSIETSKSASALFISMCKIGGKSGWFNSNWLWRLRGTLDKLFFGVGATRGRRSESTLLKDDVIDFWRVEELLPNERLLLRAEMKMPGRAWLDFKIDDDGTKRKLFVTAYFDAWKVLGSIYWFSLLPFHHFIFRDLIMQIEKRA